MSRATPLFRPRTLLLLLGVGAAAFLLLLYALGAGWDGRSDRDGGAHAASNGLTGFSALAKLLEADGRKVSLSRSKGRLDEEVLLVLTPGQFTDADELERIIAGRRYAGPTLLILPKWGAVALPKDPRIKARPGWVKLGGLWSPEWLARIDRLDQAALATGETSGWHGLGLAGTLPDPRNVQAVTRVSARSIYPLVEDGEGDVLAGWRFDDGVYPVLAEASGEHMFDQENHDYDDGAWPLVVVAEPDLLNNYGMADRRRAQVALALVDTTLEDYDLPIVFDLTIPGLGRSQNLLTLAFEPPFLAATLALILAALAIAWRALRRFGAPRAELPEFAHGKTQLARNGAGLVERARRWHLLGKPFASILATRIAARLGLREGDPAARDAAIERALAARGRDPGEFSAAAAALRAARKPHDLLRAASAMTEFERSL